MKLTLSQLRRAINNSSHSEFYLAGSGLNEYILLSEINKLLLEDDKRLKGSSMTRKASCVTKRLHPTWR